MDPFPSARCWRALGKGMTMEVVSERFGGVCRGLMGAAAAEGFP